MHLSSQISTLECSKFKCVCIIALNTISFAFVTRYVGEVRGFSMPVFDFFSFFLTLMFQAPILQWWKVDLLKKKKLT